jgi:hypothetical protein
MLQDDRERALVYDIPKLKHTTTPPRGHPNQAFFSLYAVPPMMPIRLIIRVYHRLDQKRSPQPLGGTEQ